DSEPCDDEGVRAEVRDLLFDVVIEALDDCNDEDDDGDAEDNAEECEEGSELVGPDGGPGHSDGLEITHASLRDVRSPKNVKRGLDVSEKSRIRDVCGCPRRR